MENKIIKKVILIQLWSAIPILVSYAMWQWVALQVTDTWSNIEIILIVKVLPIVIGISLYLLGLNIIFLSSTKKIKQ